MRKMLFVLMFQFLLLNFLYGQDISVSAKVDTNNVLIGDQLNYIISVSVPAKTKVTFPVLKDTLGKIEFLETLKTDTLAANGKLVLNKKYLITSFDSGYHFIPPLPVLLINKKQGLTDTFYTNPLAVRYLSVKIDTTKPIKDIKPVMDEPVTFSEYIPYILIGLGIIALVVVGMWLWKKYKRKDGPEPAYDPAIPPHVLAKEALVLLEKEKLWQKGHFKRYHSRLSEIIRTYIERQFGFLAMEMTTQEILDEFDKRKLDRELFNNLKTILELADLVKFAKYHPIPDENANSMVLAKNFVDATAVKTDDSQNTEEAGNV